jgi:hypothetical protein
MQQHTSVDSFYHIFDYGFLMHDAIDHGLVYDGGIVITKDITTTSGIQLLKGEEFHQVNFYFDKAMFAFICWQPSSESTDGTIRPTREVDIPQAELAPFLVW